MLMKGMDHTWHSFSLEAFKPREDGKESNDLTNDGAVATLRFLWDMKAKSPANALKGSNKDVGWEDLPGAMTVNASRTTWVKRKWGCFSDMGNTGTKTLQVMTRTGASTQARNGKIRRGRQVCAFKASLDYRESSRTALATQRRIK